ncbi:FtsX-like permease family protein [Catenulispora rubra]|uniref:FtsX-like permease family protein n=1 Tax=Catenulispora rubra TaxID=280293 RepID=UPI0018925670|nr:FtsX-like permease family protein [Catenulispora rubra]
MPTHRLVLSRLRRQLPTMSAVVALIVITTTLLAMLARFVSAAGDTAAQQALTSWRASGQLTAQLDSHPDPTQRSAALAALAQDTGALPHPTVNVAQVSASYALPGKTATGDPPLMTFWAVDRLDQEAELLAGAWPAKGDAAGPIQVAVPRAAADELKLAVGAQVTVVNRISGTAVHITVVGIYQPHDTADHYWQLDPLGGAGVSRPQRASSGFLQYGPFAMDAAAFDRATAPVALSTLRAQISPDPAGIGQARIQRFSDQLSALVSTLKQDTRLGSATEASLGAPAQISELRHSLAVVASSALIPTLMLALLALCALVMSASLLVEYRAGATTLMRARGAGAPTIAFQALSEALVFTVPAAILAPLIAQATVPHLFSGTSAAGSQAATWTASVVTAALCTATLVLTAIRGTNSDVLRSRSRRIAGATLRRGVLELGCVALGLLGYSQLRRYGAAGTPAADGSGTGVNLVLVTAPAFALAAAALIAVRIVPLFGWLGQTAARRGRRFSFELGAWRAGRGGRIGTPALLLVVGVAMAVLSTSYSASWRRAQTDQGTFAVGSDLRASGYNQPGILVSGIGGRLPAGDSAMLVSRDVDTVGATDTSVTVLAVQSDKVAGAVNLRPDLYPGGVSALAANLGAQSAARALAIPGQPTGLALRVKATMPGLSTMIWPAGYLADTPTATLTVSIVGRLGQQAQSSVAVPVDGREHDLTVPFDFGSGSGLGSGSSSGSGSGGGTGSAGTLAWPLTLTAVSLDVAAQEAPQAVQALQGGPGAAQPTSGAIDSRLQLAVESARPIGADGQAGAPIPAPAAGTWTSLATADQSVVDSTVSSGGGAFLNLTTSLSTISAQGTDTNVVVGYGTIPAALTPHQVDNLPPVPVVASAAFLKATGQHVGDTTKITVATQSITGHIVGEIAAMPGVDHGVPAIMVDLGRWNAQTELVTGHQVPDTTLEWWVRTAPGRSAATAAALRALDTPANVVASADTVRTLTTDPAQNGVRSAYLLAAAAAAAFALIDFLVHLIGAQRERASQNAVVRALGATRRQIVVASSVELAFLVGVGVVAGCAIGELLAHLLIPAVMVTRDGSPAVPPVVITDPWVPMAELAAAAVAALGLGVATVLSSSRRTAVGSMLRLGED